MEKIVQRIVGGLGNQLYEYAFAYSLAKKYKAELTLDLSNYTEGAFRELGLEFFDLDEYKSIKLEIKPNLVNKIYRRVKNGLLTEFITEEQYCSGYFNPKFRKAYFTGVYIL